MVNERISKEEVVNLSLLARIRLTDEEVESLQRDISGVLAYVSQISVASSKEDVGLPQLRNVFREDMPYGKDVSVSNKAEELRNAFPARDGAYNAVRKIIQKYE